MKRNKCYYYLAKLTQTNPDFMKIGMKVLKDYLNEQRVAMIGKAQKSHWASKKEKIISSNYISRYF